MSVLPAVVTPFSREKLLQVARALPADLEVLSALGEVLQDINSELDEIAALLRRDMALSTRIVRISNSPVFGGGGQVASVEEAVNRVGFSEILKLVGTATAARFTEKALDHYGISAVQLRDNMLYTALAAEALAKLAGFDPRAAYTAGLMRSLGIIVLDRASRGQARYSHHFAASAWESYSAWEGSIFGVDNCEVTALILQEWRFPAELSNAIRSHYLKRSGDAQRPLAALLNVASSLAERSARDFPGEACWWGISPQKLSACGVREDDLAIAVIGVEAEFEAAISALSA
jgi:HD-like signal output (HDOD) protein